MTFFNLYIFFLKEILPLVPPFARRTPPSDGVPAAEKYAWVSESGGVPGDAGSTRTQHESGIDPRAAGAHQKFTARVLSAWATCAERGRRMVERSVPKHYTHL